MSQEEANAANAANAAFPLAAKAALAALAAKAAKAAKAALVREPRIHKRGNVRKGAMHFIMACVQLLHEASTCRCLLYTSPSPRDLSTSRMPSSA